MSSRKETPDVLGEILSSEAEATAVPAATSPKTTSTAKQTRSRPKKKNSKTEPSFPRWQYIEVIFHNYRGYRPRYINGQEIENWRHGPIIHEYLNEIGEKGWELAGTVHLNRSELHAYLKKRKI